MSNNDQRQDAVNLLSNKKYKLALERFKALEKQFPSEDYSEALNQCYLGRSHELTIKNMHQEAAVLWERHSKYCSQCHHQTSYLYLQLSIGKLDQAAQLFAQLQGTLDGAGASALEEIFAALVLTNASLLAHFPTDSLISRQFKVIQEAFEAFEKGNVSDIGAILQKISFRSPYKHLKQILKACLILKTDRSTATSLLKHVPSNSPFYRIAQLVMLAYAPQIALARAVTNLSQADFECLARMKGWSIAHQKFINELRVLHEPNPKIFFKMMIANLKHINKTAAKRLAYSLLPSFITGVKAFEREFGMLSEDEKGQLAALSSKKPRAGWIEYEKKLGELEQTPIISLKRALVLRQIADSLQKRSGTNAVNESSIPYLTRSLEIDPEDKPTFLKVIAYFKKQGSKRELKKWVKSAASVFQKDRDILLTAIELNYQEKNPIYAKQLTKRLLELDPLNMDARKYKIELDIAHLRSYIEKAQYAKADVLLQELRENQVGQSHPLLVLHQGFGAYLKGQIDEAATLIQQYDQNNLHKRFILLVEASKYTQLTNRDLQKELKLKPIKNLEFNDKNQLIETLFFISKSKINKELKEYLLEIKKPLKQTAHLNFNQLEIGKICEQLAGAGLFELLDLFLKSFLPSQRRSSPTLMYYEVFTRTKGNVARLGDSGYEKLSRAMALANAQGNERMCHLIRKLLTEAELGRMAEFFDPFGGLF